MKIDLSPLVILYELIVPWRHLCGGSYCFIVLVLKFCAVSTLCKVCFHIFGYVWVTECPPFEKIAAHSAYYMFS